MNTVFEEANNVLDSLKMHFETSFAISMTLNIHCSSNVFVVLFKSNVICYSFLYTNMAANYDPWNTRFLVWEENLLTDIVTNLTILVLTENFSRDFWRCFSFLSFFLHFVI